MSVNRLFGDGIHDDYPAIQELLDSGIGEICLPAPAKFYVISKTLKIGSNTELKLGRFTRIRLADNSNCCMMENADTENWNENVSVVGGIWDMNHNNQWRNPYHFPMPNGLTTGQERERDGYTPASGRFYPGYSGMCFRFRGIRNFSFSDLTIENPVVYGAQFAYIEDFTIENLVFDFYEGSPKLWNLDGIHLEGGCKRGVVRNLKGACHDDMVAITSDDGCYGEIENITVDGLFAEGSHSAVRLLSVTTPIKNISISNVFGSFYVYCIIMSQYYEAGGKRGKFENIRFTNICARLCEGTVDVPGNYEPLIAIKKGLDIDELAIDGLYRDESRCALPTIGIQDGAHIGRLTVNGGRQRNSTGTPFPFLLNEGQVDEIRVEGVNVGNDELIV